MFVPRCSFVFSASIFNLLVLLFHEMRDYIIVLRTRERGLDADYTCMKKKTFCLSLSASISVFTSVFFQTSHCPACTFNVHNNNNNQALLYCIHKALFCMITG